VRFDQGAALPDRCVACNAAAEGYRLKRTLHHSPLAWRVGASLAPFAALLAGAWLGLDWLSWAFFPLLVILIVANMFVRRSVQLELGVCARHRDMRLGLLAATWACVAGVFIGFTAPSGILILLCLAGILVFGLAQGYVGVQAVRVTEISTGHAWLSGTGEPFRAGLPELH
jgi:hypothetical protein